MEKPKLDSDMSGAHPASYKMGAMGCLPWCTAPQCETDHSPAFSAEVKYGGAVPPLAHKSSGHSA
jgi:hypothetical protein